MWIKIVFEINQLKKSELINFYQVNDIFIQWLDNHYIFKNFEFYRILNKINELSVKIDLLIWLQNFVDSYIIIIKQSITHLKLIIFSVHYYQRNVRVNYIGYT